MPTRTIKLLKEVEKTDAIAGRIVALASKEKRAAAVTLGKLGTNKGGCSGAKSAKRQPRIAKEVAKGR